MDAVSLLSKLASYTYIAVEIAVSIKRAGIVLSALPGWLFFHERNITDKVIAASVIFCGFLILYLLLSAALVSILTLAGMTLTLNLTRNGASESSCGMTPMTGPLTVAFVGCGGMAAHYLAIYRDLVACAVDVNPENARLAAAILDAEATSDTPPRSPITSTPSSSMPRISCTHRKPSPPSKPASTSCRKSPLPPNRKTQKPSLAPPRALGAPSVST